MQKIKSLDELKKVREEVKNNIKLGERTKITIGMGTCGIAVGAQKVKNAILNELERKKIKANVIGVGCVGLCFGEPIVTIKKSGKAKVIYGRISAEKVPRLIEEHIIKDNVIEKWTVKRHKMYEN